MAIAEWEDAPMSNLLIYADTLRSAAMRHEVPLMTPILCVECA
jgi:hypothetical protein